MTFNTHDKIAYGTEAEMLASDRIDTESTKWYVYGDFTTAGKMYVSNGTIWTLVE